MAAPNGRPLAAPTIQRRGHVLAAAAGSPCRTLSRFPVQFPAEFPRRRATSPRVPSSLLSPNRTASLVAGSASRTWGPGSARGHRPLRSFQVLIADRGGEAVEVPVGDPRKRAVTRGCHLAMLSEVVRTRRSSHAPTDDITAPSCDATALVACACSARSSTSRCHRRSTGSTRGSPDSSQRGGVVLSAVDTVMPRSSAISR